MFNQLKATINKKLDDWFPVETAPRPRQSRPAKPAPAPSVTYEEWKIGKIGHGPKVKAPRGYGQDWEARLYCERALDWAKYYRDTDKTKKQYRTGSRPHRRHMTMKSAHRQAWQQGIEIAQAVIEADVPVPGGCWTGKKELVKEAFYYTSYLLALAGD